MTTQETTSRIDGVGAYADVNGINLYYETYGTGDPLILLHGGLVSIESFGPNIGILAGGRRVIGVDLQGHGRTADVDRPISTETMGDDIAALIRHLGLERVDVMGYSLGGGVALQTVLRHRALVRRLVIVSTNFRRAAFYPEILAQQGQVNAQAAEFIKQTPMYEAYARLNPRPEDFPRLLDKMGEAMAEDFDFGPQIAALDVPTLVVVGDADIFPVRHAVEMFELLGGNRQDAGWDGSGRPKSDLAVLPRLTHYTISAAPALGTTVAAWLDEFSGEER